MPGENLRKTGSEMEEVAAEYLTEHGVRILERNFRSREAEIDIIGKDGETLIFVEVKARKAGKKSGEASEAVGTAKQKRICRCADFYMHEKGIDPFGTMIRFDVVAITEGTGDNSEPGRIIENVVDLSGKMPMPRFAGSGTLFLIFHTGA